MCQIAARSVLTIFKVNGNLRHSISMPKKKQILTIFPFPVNYPPLPRPDMNADDAKRDPNVGLVGSYLSI